MAIKGTKEKKIIGAGKCIKLNFVINYSYKEGTL